MGKTTAIQETKGDMPPFTDGIRWETWEFQLKLVIADKGFTAEKKKVNFLLKSLGLEVLEKLIDWCAPDEPTDIGYNELLAILRSKFIIKKNKFALRLGVLNEKQDIDESAREYFSKMTQKFGHCDLQKMTPDEYGVLVLLRGLRNDDMRDFLMNPANDISTVEKLEELAVAYEDSRKAARDIKAVGKDPVKPMSINIVGKGVPICGCCGKQHGKGKCAAIDVECWHCQKVGHFARLCKTRREKDRHSQNQVYEGDSDSADDDKVNQLNGIYPDIGVLSVASVSEDGCPPAFVRLKVDGRRIKFQHDTGSGVSIVNRSIWNQLGKPKLYACENLRSYNGVIKTLGKCMVQVKLGNVNSILPLTVVERGRCLLGREWMQALKVNVILTFDEQSQPKHSYGCKPGGEKKVLISSSFLKNQNTKVHRRETTNRDHNYRNL